MATKKAYTVTDLGGGDGGKGGVVHKLCALRQPHTVVKVGGAQGSHGVHTSTGEKFNFSQFGCGTFNGAATFISDRFVISPIGILNEATALRYEQGINDPFGLLTVDGNALCTTPFHGLATRLRELSRQGEPRGTVGVGIGEAFLDAMIHPELALRARDLKRPDLRDVIETVRLQKINELQEVIEVGFLPDDIEEARSHIHSLHNPEFTEWTVEQFERAVREVKIVDTQYLREQILARDGVIVFESSHGILTDRFHGFYPHVSRLRTLPEITSWSLLRENEYDGEVIKLGVTRAYQIRHGAGPLVTDDPQMADELTQAETSPPDRYRGKVRVGPLDCVALRYALEVCGGPQAFDALAVTWFDHVTRVGSWKICNSYKGATDPTYFSPTGEILVRRGEDSAQLFHQEKLTQALLRCRPNCTEYKVLPWESQKDRIELCSGVLREKLGVPVRMMSFGPTENDKVCF